jgi:hypothetical protein
LPGGDLLAVGVADGGEPLEGGKRVGGGGAGMHEPGSVPLGFSAAALVRYSSTSMLVVGCRVVCTCSKCANCGEWLSAHVDTSASDDE